MRRQALAVLSLAFLLAPASASADDDATSFVGDVRLVSGHLLELALAGGVSTLRASYGRSQGVQAGTTFTSSAQVRGRLASIFSVALSGDFLPGPAGAPDPAAPDFLRGTNLRFANMSLGAGVYAPPLWLRMGAGVGITAGAAVGTEIARMGSTLPRGGSFVEPEVQLLVRLGVGLLESGPETRPLFLAAGASWRRYAGDTDLTQRWAVSLAVGIDFVTVR